MPLNYALSWLLNFIIMAVIAAIVDKAYENKIEEHQLLGAFILFAMPTLIELASFIIRGRPSLF
ncbi:hypothetical protein DRN74_01015 [Candidatus Micrarchaeota archaeon]|nr:MAG: hypothetical protein DRN74_01015 [Candidatus Micrarchaeota archaeon]